MDTWKLLVLLPAVLLIGCTTHPTSIITSPPPVKRTALFQFPYFQDQPTGIAVSRNGRIFVSFPRWGKDPLYSVVEVRADGILRPFPDKTWNRWGAGEAEHPEAHFICVQSVVVDDADFLWIVDAASPSFEGVVPGGAKLVRINLETGFVENVIPLNPPVLPINGYLNDVRVDTAGNTAFVTDSGSGAIIVIDLDTRKSRRVLAGHPSTKAEADYVPIIDGKELRDRNGKVPQIHADGIALSKDWKYLYYHALTGRTLYRIMTRYLKDPGITETELAMHVEKVAETGAVDGMAMDEGGNLLYTAIEENAVKRYHSDGKTTTVVQDPHLHWPDSLAISPDRYLYFTDSQINLSPRFNNGFDKHIPPYSFFKIWLTPLQQ